MVVMPPEVCSSSRSTTISVSSKVLVARASEAADWMFWPTMMTLRRTSWMYVCAIHDTRAMRLAFTSQDGNVLWNAWNWLRMAGRLMRAITETMQAQVIDPTPVVTFIASHLLKRA